MLRTNNNEGINKFIVAFLRVVVQLNGVLDFRKYWGWNGSSDKCQTVRHVAEKLSNCNIW